LKGENDRRRKRNKEKDKGDEREIEERETLNC
jgi:hypothetical protein